MNMGSPLKESKFTSYALVCAASGVVRPQPEANARAFLAISLMIWSIRL